jgi:hypothetical protein
VIKLCTAKFVLKWHTDSSELPSSIGEQPAEFERNSALDIIYFVMQSESIRATLQKNIMRIAILQRLGEF